MTAAARIVLKPGREKSLRHRHPWIFSGAVESVEGEGSVFILKLPRHDEDAGEDDGGVVSAAALAAAE